MKNFKTISAWLIGIGFIVAGSMHFFIPEFYLRIIPPALPAHELINIVSGVAEIILGILMFIPRFRVFAAWALIALLIAVFPANIYMALEAGKSIDASPVVAYIRLPFQFLFIWWVFQQTKK